MRGVVRDGNLEGGRLRAGSWPVMMQKILVVVTALAGLASAEPSGTLRLGVRDDATGAALPARLYIRDEEGGFHLPPPESGFHVYNNADTGFNVRETYTLLPAKPVDIPLPPGGYELTVERGRAYLPLTAMVTVRAGQAVQPPLRLRRIIDMAARGWYSGDVHVHTPPADLPAAMLADDLNVAFPISAWAIADDAVPAPKPPATIPARGEVVAVDPTHIYWSLNTEYEIFRCRGERHVLGAVLILGHQRPFTMTVPPLAGMIAEARSQNAILDLEKPSWPWTPAVAPLIGSGTFGIANNSMWRQKTVSAYLWGREPMDWVGAAPLTARQFVDYGLENWYALLNCGFDLVPSAGSANGVHPVPAGTSRVYVRVDGPFSYEKWLEGFRQGRSFVTDGPLLLMTVDGREAGDRVTLSAGERRTVQVDVEAVCVDGVERVEMLWNGDVRCSRPGTGGGDDPAARSLRFSEALTIEGSGWLAARCFERGSPDQPRFAHTGIVRFTDPTRPLYPTTGQIRYLIEQVEALIERGRTHLAPEALTEFERALEVYRKIARDAANASSRPADR